MEIKILTVPCGGKDKDDVFLTIQWRKKQGEGTWRGMEHTITCNHRTMMKILIDNTIDYALGAKDIPDDYMGITDGEERLS